MERLSWTPQLERFPGAARLRWVGLSLFLLAMVGVGRAASFTASLDRDNITLGESATLSLTFEGGAPGGQPALPAIPHVQVGPVSQSSSFNFVNGQSSSSVTYSFPLTPTHVGEIEIPAFRVAVDGNTLASEPLKLNVLKPGMPPATQAEAASQMAFLKLVLPKKQAYAGEIVPIELQIYLADVVQNLGDFQMTAMPAEGCTVGKTIEGQRRRERVGNRVFTVIPLTIALSPMKTGTLTIGPIACAFNVQLPADQSQRALDPFGFFNRAQLKHLALATEPATLQSLPLPAENVPPNFSGAVGNYSVSATVGPTNVAVGDPITVKIQIAGRGDVNAISLPEQPAWREFKTYPPTSKVETTDPLGIQGAKAFEQVVVPQNTEIKDLPAFSFSFFDPETRKYRTVTHPAVPLIVRPGGSSPLPTLAGPVGGATEDKPPAQDIVSIKQRLGTPGQVGPPLVQQLWFVGVQAIPVLAWAGLLVRRRRAESFANNPRLRRQRAVAQLVRDGLDTLGKLAADNKPDEFFATLFRLLQEQLGERLDCPASAITEAVVDERLKACGLPEMTLNSLRELFQSCNLARYAPVKSSQELAAVIPQLERILGELRNMKA